MIILRVTFPVSIILICPTLYTTLLTFTNSICCLIPQESANIFSSIDGAYFPWSKSLREHLLKSHPLPEGLSPIPLDVRLPPNYTIELAPTIKGLGTTMDNSHESAGDSRDNGDVTITDAPCQDTIDHQSLDRAAAQFSHEGLTNANILEGELRNQRAHFSSYAIPARLSEGTAKIVRGGIDLLDRPNVLRDAPSKYSLDDTSGSGEVSVPPVELLPIPGSFAVELRANRRLTPHDHWQDVRQLVFHIIPRRDIQSKDPVEPFYKPGDVLTLYPKNFPADVQALIDLMGWGDVADQPFEHQSRKGAVIPGIPSRSTPKNCFPIPGSTLRQLLLHNYDITAIPKRIFFEQIAWHTNDATHQERLREFADPKYTDEFWDYTSRPRRSILEILQDFPSVQIPFQEIPSIFPVIRGREYSIASGGLLLKAQDSDDLRAELLVALVKYKTVLRKTRQGLCSRYLASLKPGSIVNVTIGENQGPPNEIRHVRAPLLAIGPGTGIAPLRALIHHRVSHEDHGENVVIYGGRSKQADFFFRNEWADLGVKVLTAFSRDQPEKIYVQDVIRQQARLVCFLIQRGAAVCLCGSSGRMPLAVRQALYDALVIGGLAPDVETAKRIFDQKVEYWEEVW